MEALFMLFWDGCTYHGLSLLNKCCLVGFMVSFIPLTLILSFCRPSCDSVWSRHWCMYTYMLALDVCESSNIFLKKY